MNDTARMQEGDWVEITGVHTTRLKGERGVIVRAATHFVTVRLDSDGKVYKFGRTAVSPVFEEGYDVTAGWSRRQR